MIALEFLRRKRQRDVDFISRDFDRYPKSVTPDFRQCSVETLQRYVAFHNIEVEPESGQAELAAAVAHHFDSELDASEEEIIPNFVEYVLQYNGGNTVRKQKQESKRSTRPRKRTRGADADNGEAARARQRKVLQRRERDKERSQLRSRAGTPNSEAGSIAAAGSKDDASVQAKRRGGSAGSVKGAKRKDRDKEKGGVGRRKPRGRHSMVETAARAAARASNKVQSKSAGEDTDNGSVRGKGRNRGSAINTDVSSQGEEEDEETNGKMNVVDGGSDGKRSGDGDTGGDDDDDDGVEEEEDDGKLYCTCRRPGYGEMISCDADDCEINWFHVECLDFGDGEVPEEDEPWLCPKCAAKEANADGSSRRRSSASTGKDKDKANGGKRPNAPSYIEMISATIRGLPKQRGTYAQICERIETDYSDHLNWKSEAKTSVWKSSVRKMLCQTDKFTKEGEIYSLNNRQGRKGNKKTNT